MKKKILFALKDMNIGGVEKSLLSLLNEMDQSQYDVTVLLLKRNGGFLKSIPKWVHVKVLNEYEEIESIVNNPPIVEIEKLFKKGRIVWATQLLLAYIWYKLKGSMIWYYHFAFAKVPDLKEVYDIAISYTSIISYLTYYVKYKVKADTKIGWIHFDVNKLQLDKKTLCYLHKDFHKIYVVSQEAYDNFVHMFPTLCKKCEVRYNVISRKYIEQLSKEDVEDMDYPGMKIVTLGRISKEKGQDMIPNIAKKLKEQGIEFKWYLIGDGSLKEELKSMITLNHLENEIILLGAKENPYPYLKKADIYVQTSVYEGYCISLAEARMLEIPIITTDFAGAKEQITDQKTGSIVEVGTDSITSALIDLIKNLDKCQYYRKNLGVENKGKEYEN